MQRTAVLNVVGLTRALLGPATPNISRFVSSGSIASITPAFPAVTCTAQANYVTGLPPSEHGVVGNGWFDRDLSEVHFWKQSDRLVHGRKIWEELRAINPAFTCAKLFWWFNMYGAVDYSITPRPIYRADGNKIFDISSSPLSIRDEIKRDLGDFPFRHFWGPLAGIESSRWIAASARWIEEKFQPALNLIYLPHLDYNLQRLGPDDKKITCDLQQIDAVVGDLLDFFDERKVRVLLLSEYGITGVDAPVHLNRLFRQRGWLTIKDECGLEILDCGASAAFAVADHQVAHVYVNDAARAKDVRIALENEPGVREVLDAESQRARGILHSRAGTFVAVAKPQCWFTYYYWFDDAVAPDFARTVDIHRKPGYDPAELFVDPQSGFPKARIAYFLLRKKLGFRALMRIVPLDASLVKGSHGAIPEQENEFPVIASQTPLPKKVDSLDIYRIIKKAVLGKA